MQSRYPYLYPDENDDRIDSPAVRIMFAIFGIVFISVIALIGYLDNRNRQKYCAASCEADKNLGIQGVVTQIDTPAPGSRGIAPVYFHDSADGVKIYNGAWHVPLNQYLHLGDSVVKLPGDFTFRVFRKGAEIDPVRGSDTSCVWLCR